LSSAALLVFGDDRHSARKARPDPVNLRVDTGLVLVPVSVTDLVNHPVTGLTKENFRVFDNSIEHTVLSVAREDAPMAIAVVFDTSASMSRKLAKSRAAIAELLRSANPEDEFCLVEFNDRVEVAQSWTEDTGAILDRLRSAAPRGRTALLDAIATGLRELKRSAKPRKALVILSDGGDNRSRQTEREIRSTIEESDALIYAMGIFETSGTHLAPEEIDGPRLLNDLSEASGGRLFTVANLRELPAIAAQIGVELHNQYILAYAAGAMIADGKHHRVKVKVVPPPGSAALRADWRTGYRVPARPPVSLSESSPR